MVLLQMGMRVICQLANRSYQDLALGCGCTFAAQRPAAEEDAQPEQRQEAAAGCQSHASFAEEFGYLAWLAHRNRDGAAAHGDGGHGRLVGLDTGLRGGGTLGNSRQAG